MGALASPSRARGSVGSHEPSSLHSSCAETQVPLLHVEATSHGTSTHVGSINTGTVADTWSMNERLLRATTQPL